jgi:DNA-binding IclR family transcriptional regulator
MTQQFNQFPAVSRLGATPIAARPNRLGATRIRRRSPVSINGDEQDARGSGIQVIARAAEMLRLLQAHPGGLSQAEIGERLGMARSTVSRILNALDDEGLVATRSGRGPYRLGPELARMASTVRLSIVMDVHPFMEELSRELEETVDLSILDEDRARFVDQVVSPHRLRAISAVGESFPLHCCANGKAILASLPPAQQAQVLPKRLSRLTPNTITTPAALRKELDRIQVEGVAYDREEQTEGVCAVGAVLRGVSSPVVAVSVPVPSQRFYRREEELAEALLAWVERVNVWFQNTNS